MKRLLSKFMGAALSLVALSACTDSIDAPLPDNGIPSVPGSGEMVTVTFNTTSAAGVRSRSGRWNPEGLSLWMGVYDSSNNLLIQQQFDEDDCQLGNGQSMNLSVNLAKDSNYKVFFWAEMDYEDYFDCDLGSACITVNSYAFSRFLFQDTDAEDSWAYCAYVDVDTHSSTGLYDVVLKSPFSEVVVAADYGDKFSTLFPYGIESVIGDYRGDRNGIYLPSKWNFLDDTIEWSAFDFCDIEMGIYFSKYAYNVDRNGLNTLGIFPVLCQRGGTTFAPSLVYTDQPDDRAPVRALEECAFQIALPSHRFLPNTRVTFVDHGNGSGAINDVGFSVDVTPVFADRNEVDL